MGRIVVGENQWRTFELNGTALPHLTFLKREYCRLWEDILWYSAWWTYTTKACLVQWGLVCAPHVLISTDQHWVARGSFWSALIRIQIPPSPAILAGKQLSNGPTQHCSALNELISAESLKAEQNWTELSDTEQCWVMPAVIIIIIKRKCMGRDWTMASIDIM